MNLKRCAVGHFYDSDKYSTCPHCKKNVGDQDLTVAVTHQEKADTVSVKGEQESIVDVVQQNEKISYQEDDDKTVSVSNFVNGTDGAIKDPVVGWLVCVEGPNFGESYTLKAGKNYIGRAFDSDVCVAEDKAVSRNKHAIIVFEPRMQKFYAQPGESKELYYINDEVVLGICELKLHDHLLVGNSLFVFIPLSGNGFNWEDYRNITG